MRWAWWRLRLGLVDTATGQAVNLSLTAGGVVEGRTATSNDLVLKDDGPAVTFGNLVGTGTTLPQFGLARWEGVGWSR